MMPRKKTLPFAIFYKGRIYQGDEVQKKMGKRNSISCYAYTLVDAVTGEATALKGTELEKAAQDKKVITRGTYHLRNHRKRKNGSTDVVSEEVSHEEPKGDSEDEFVPPPSKRRKHVDIIAVEASADPALSLLSNPSKRRKHVDIIAAEAPNDLALSSLPNKDAIFGYVNTQLEPYLHAEEATPDHGGLEREYSVPATKRIMEKTVDMPSALLPQDPVPHIEEPFSWFAPPCFQDAIEMMESGVEVYPAEQQGDDLDESHDVQPLHFLSSDDQERSNTSIFNAAYTTGSPFVLFSERQRSPAPYQPQERKSGDITSRLIPMTKEETKLDFGTF